ASAAASGPVTEEQAKSIALSQAGLTEDQVAAMRTETHTRRGQSVFEVEFRGSDGSEYSCDISASDGSVISYDYDARGNAPTVNTEAGMLSEEQIRAAVLERVPGASADSIRLELDEDDSRLIYEGELFYDNTEYEFQIDAYSGAVLEWESDSVRRP
ncbi:MAG TPA: PepSY domain-containing protein, partial [Candidatus Lachnoclostridium stercorigallinarum]|nr:PepSY domain-containing protein [Candidatus Lachnoclostridium stercorigallinarum]